MYRQNNASLEVQRWESRENLSPIILLYQLQRGDAVLFKQKVYEKSGKRHSKCIGKRIVAGKVIKESYGKEKQQHTFTIQVFWSRGVGKLLPLSLLLIKGRNLYRMMTFRQPWPNEAERLRALDKKHNRGDAARRIRSLNRQSTGNALKGKKTIERKRHQARSERSDHGSNIIGVDKGKKHSIKSSNFDQPNKRPKKRGQLPSIGTCNSGRTAKKNRTHFDKSICTGSREKMQKIYHSAPLNTEVAMSKRNPCSEQMNSVSQAHFEERSNGLSSVAQANCAILAGRHPLVGRHQRPPPLREVGNIWMPRPGRNSVHHPLVERHQRPPPMHEVGNIWLPRFGGN